LDFETQRELFKLTRQIINIAMDEDLKDIELSARKLAETILYRVINIT